jgi:Zn-dependent protease with chaperone function
MHRVPAGRVPVCSEPERLSQRGTAGMPNACWRVQNAFPNAYTLAIAGKRPFIMLNTALLELLTEDELQVVIAHELGHLKCDHGVWLTVANVLATTSSSVLPVVSAAVEEALFKWMRAAELTCDRCAVPPLRIRGSPAHLLQVIVA